ncbi:MAG: Cof-type HAD-IIB family hydrolase [Aeromonas popoffii]|uniref:Cof-type HAD-IIB family hydrolase n=1 Tax=Aeromonas popoffii TaxID=70856 RepID=UPI003F349EB1
MKKIIFIDVDGTLSNPAGMVPISAKEAIKEARENGHLAFICTGRSKPEITSEIIDIGFDGIIGAGGGYIEVAGQLVKHLRMPESAVIEIIEYFNVNDIGYYLESNDGLFASENCIASIKSQVTKCYEEGRDEYSEALDEFNWFFNILEQSLGGVIDYANVNKISFISNGHPYAEVANKFQDRFAMYHTTVPQFGPESGEIAVKGVDKYVAVNFVLDYVGLTAADAFAFGDGNNDIAMFSAVAHSVAMENGTAQLKSVANEITNIADEHGIRNSFIKNGLI